jgi:hypothetical protein
MFAHQREIPTAFNSRRLHHLMRSRPRGSIAFGRGFKIFSSHFFSLYLRNLPAGESAIFEQRPGNVELPDTDASILGC